MDTVTHILSGALVARAIAPALPGNDKAPVALGTAMLCGAAAAAFPDIDIVASAFGQLAYLLNHRGITHSLLILPLWALLVACLFAVLARQRQHWLALYPYAFAGLLIHVLGDMITAYGTMILTPFSDTRFGWGTTFIIDLWLVGIILAGLLLSWYWRQSRIPALTAIAALVACIGLQAVLKQQAIEAGQTYARSIGQPQAEVDALPQPFSPFRWLVVVKGNDVYWYAHLNVRHHENPSPAAPADGWLARYYGNYPFADQAVWQRVEKFGNGPQTLLSRQVFNEPRFAFYRWFATYPMLERIEPNAQGQCVWFQDLRFKFPELERPTFRFGMCSSGNEWIPVRWAGEGVRKVLE